MSIANNDPTITVLDSVDMDLTGVQLGKALLNSRVKSVITGCRWELPEGVANTPENRSQAQLRIAVATVEPATSTLGKEVPPGLENEFIIRGVKGKRDMGMVKKELGWFQTAYAGSDEPGKLVPSEAEGKEVYVTYKVEAGRVQNPQTGAWENDPTKMYQRVGRWEKV